MSNLQNGNFSFSASGDGQLPDLYVYTSGAWADGIIVATEKGSISVYSLTTDDTLDISFFEENNDVGAVYSLTTDDTLYISYVVVNNDVGAADSFAGMLLVDNVAVYSLECNNGLPYRKGVIAEDVYIGSLAAGRHVLKVQCDYYDSVVESNELNNDYSIIITVRQGESSPVDYLLDTRWDQRGNGKSAYAYNKFVPDGQRTGCSNTALAQILYYWVEQGYGLQLQVTTDDYMYRLSGCRKETIDAANLQERCGIDLDELNSVISSITCDTPNWDEDDDIAGLTLASMLILNSEIGDTGTATNMSAETALLDRADFNYEFVKCTSADSIPWKRIQANINDDCPVFAGVKSIMHTLVIDGYNSGTGEYHLNFGWGFEGYKSDKKYGFETGTGWYSPDELDALDITYLVLDIYPDYDIDDPTKKALRVVDWSDRITPEMDIDNGFLVTIATPSQMLSLNVSLNGVNIFTSVRNATLSCECMDRTLVLERQKLQAIFSKDDAPLLLNGEDNGLTDLFFARGSGVWEGHYIASHVGGTGEWNGTGEYAYINGKNRFCDIFEGTGGSAILRLTDDVCGDAIFADDIFSASCENYGKNQSRLNNLHEIIAGAGDDIVDMTSGRFAVESSNLVIHGNEGDDILWGCSTKNTLFGDAGNDRLVGGPVNDVIVGGSGDDRIACEGGEDILCFGANWGQDVVTQTVDGRLVLWFEQGDISNWNAEEMLYRDGGNTVSVAGGIAASDISFRFGDDNGSDAYYRLRDQGAFLA